MKIGVLSDTHLKSPDDRLRKIIQDHFSDSDMILHAGDLIDPSVLDAFEGKEVLAVCGNMDARFAESELPFKRTIEVGGFRIGLIHGWGPPQGIEDRVRGEFSHVDCIVFGHSHYPVNAWRDGILFFNPGTAFERRFNVPLTVGILEVGDEIRGTIIPVGA